MPTKKRNKKKNGGNKQAGPDVSYTSKLWKRDVTATDIFINPTVDTGEGTRQLAAIASEGMSEFVDKTTELFHQSKQADHDHHYIFYSNLYILREKQKEQGIKFKEKQHQRALLQKTEPFEQQKLRTDAALDQANDLVYKFEQLEKLAKNLLATQEELGDQITKIDSGRKKVATTAKCIDAVWKNIITTYNRFNKLQEQILVVKATLPPVAGHVTPIVIEGGKDENGNDLGPQKLWIYDPNQVPVSEPGRFKDLDHMDGHDSTDGNKRIDGLPRIESLEDEMTGTDSTPASSDEATLVEEFENKCQLTVASEDSRSLIFATSPSTLDVKNSDGGRGDQGENAVIEEQKKKPMTVGSDRKRKARDNSPVREDSAEENDEEAEGDDELEFICE